MDGNLHPATGSHKRRSYFGKAKYKSKAFILDQLKNTTGTKSLPIVFSNKAFRRVTLNTYHSNVSELLKGSYLKPRLSIKGLGA